MKSIKLISIIIITFVLLFGTSFLLDTQIVQQNPIRKILVYVLVLLELAIGVSLFIQLSKTQPPNNQ